jgi:hypothetical protein
LEKKIDKYAVCLSLTLSLYSEYFTNEALEGFRDTERGGQVICTMKYADDLLLLAKK